MMIVRVILVVWTTPVKMRPLIDTFPVNGHFLSTYVPSIASRGVEAYILIPSLVLGLTLDGLGDLRGLEDRF
jgi:hypothetical protein